jgi:hypothetical protein
LATLMPREETLHHEFVAMQLSLAGQGVVRGRELAPASAFGETWFRHGGGHPAGVGSHLQRAETAHLADDRFRHLNDLRSDASNGDVGVVRTALDGITADDRIRPGGGFALKDCPVCDGAALFADWIGPITCAAAKLTSDCRSRRPSVAES